MRPVDLWYALSFVSLVIACVFWELHLPVYWAVATAVYLCCAETKNMYMQGELWDPLGESSNALRAWRVRTGIVLILSIIATCVVCVTLTWTNYMEWSLMFTAAVYISTSIPACFALAQHANRSTEAASARSSLASCTFFHIMYGVFTLVLGASVSAIENSDDKSWRTIASYLVWMSILHLIYVEYPRRGKSFQFLRFSSFLVFYLVLCVRLHDSADSMISMRFTSSLDWVILIFCALAFSVALMHKFVNGAYISE